MRNSLSYSPELSTQRYANRARSKPHPIRAVQAPGQHGAGCCSSGATGQGQRTRTDGAAGRAAPSQLQAFLLAATPLQGTAAPQSPQDHAAPPACTCPGNSR